MTFEFYVKNFREKKPEKPNNDDINGILLDIEYQLRKVSLIFDVTAEVKDDEKTNS